MNFGSLLDMLTDSANGLSGQRNASHNVYVDSLRNKVEQWKEKAGPILAASGVRTDHRSGDVTASNANVFAAASSFDSPTQNNSRTKSEKKAPAPTEADFAMHFATVTPTKGKSSELRYEVRIRDREPIRGTCSIASGSTQAQIQEAILEDIGFTFESRVQEMSAKDSKTQIFEGFNGYASLFSGRK